MKVKAAYQLKLTIKIKSGVGVMVLVAFDVIDIYQQHTCKKIKESIIDLKNFYESSDYCFLKEQEENKTIKNQRRLDKKNVYQKPQTEQANLLIKQKIIQKLSYTFGKITNFYQQQLFHNPKALTYLLKERKLKVETIKAFQLGATNKNNQFLVSYVQQQNLEEAYFIKLGLLKKK